MCYWEVSEWLFSLCQCVIKNEKNCGETLVKTDWIWRENRLKMCRTRSTTETQGFQTCTMHNLFYIDIPYFIFTKVIIFRTNAWKYLLHSLCSDCWLCLLWSLKTHRSVHGFILKRGPQHTFLLCIHLRWAPKQKSCFWMPLILSLQPLCLKTMVLWSVSCSTIHYVCLKCSWKFSCYRMSTEKPKIPCNCALRDRFLHCGQPPSCLNCTFRRWAFTHLWYYLLSPFHLWDVLIRCFLHIL